MNARSLTAALGGKWHRSYGTACCPAHDDRRPSLKIVDGENGEPILHCFAGCDWRDVKAVLRLDGLLRDRDDSESHREPLRQARAESRNSDDTRKRISAARRIWQSSRSTPGTLVETYLGFRGIRIPTPLTIRYHASLRHGPTGLFLPAMVAAVTIYPSREVVAVHRTFLKANGAGKAPVSNQKMALGPCAGGAARLAAAGSELVLAEGVETALSVLQATEKPAWATLGTSGLKAVRLPPDVKTVIIAADSDEPGEKAAQEAARRLSAEGRVVRIARPPLGLDFNDLLLNNVPGIEERAA